MNLKPNYSNIMVALLVLFAISILSVCVQYDKKIDALTKEYNQQLGAKEYKIGVLEEEVRFITNEMDMMEFYKETQDRYSDEYFRERVAKAYDVDYNLMEAIYIHETGNFTSNKYVYSNNVCGNRYENSYKFVKYISVDASIIACVRNIKFNYIDEGLTTIESIGAKYAPLDDSSDTQGVNNHWVDAVTRIYNELTNKK